MSAAKNFEIVGTYFVDIFYNVLYAKARQQMMASTKQISITDLYMSLAHQYPPHCAQKYSEVAKMVYNYYLRKSGAPCAFDEFQKALIMGIVPESHYKLLSVNERDKVMRDVLLKLVKSLYTHIVKSGVKFIIDERTEPIGKDRIRALQNKCVDIFEEIKADYHVKLNSNSNAVDQKVFTELQEQVALRVKAEQALLKANNTIKQLRIDNGKLEDKIDSLNEKLDGFKYKSSTQVKPNDDIQDKQHSVERKAEHNVERKAEHSVERKAEHKAEHKSQHNVEHNATELETIDLAEQSDDSTLFSLTAEDLDDEEMDKLTNAATRR